MRYAKVCLVFSAAVAAALPAHASQVVMTAGASSPAPCFVFGDSIAQGVAQHLPQCASNTRVGRTSVEALKVSEAGIQAPTVIISMGVNDQKIPTRANLDSIRSHIKATEIIWILPHDEGKNAIVTNVAAQYQDPAIGFGQVVSKDGIHPTGQGYAAIAHSLQLYMNRNTKVEN